MQGLGQQLLLRSVHTSLQPRPPVSTGPSPQRRGRRSRRTGGRNYALVSSARPRDSTFTAGPIVEAQAHPLDVGALDPARLAPGDRADKGAHIIDERVVRKARFADPGMDDAGLFGAELDLAALDRLDRLGDVLGDRTEPRVGHQPARPQDLAEPADHRHHVGSGDGAVEIDLPGLHLLGEVLGPDDIGAGGFAPPWRGRRARTPRPARSCRCRAAASPCRAGSGRASSGRD